MKVGIVVYSATGTTFAVAEKIMFLLKTKKIDVELERIEIAEEGYKYKHFNLTKQPDLSRYDYIIIGSPVEAFHLSRVTKRYLTKIKSLENKKVICYVTQLSPYKWMGGNKSIEELENIFSARKAEVLETYIINRKSRQANHQIDDLMKKIDNIFE